ncbi:hypothetical protein AAVH_36003 [Aphelenchoides avenae]|nr:hypothetical protein AAVH_36003 [Aphelenchus avenae]
MMLLFRELRGDRRDPVDFDLYVRYLPVMTEEDNSTCLYDVQGRDQFGCRDHECLAREPVYFTVFQLDKVPDQVAKCEQG